MTYKILFILVILKMFLLGGDFNIVAWICDGKQYTDWYYGRQSYTEFKKQPNTREVKHDR